MTNYKYNEDQLIREFKEYIDGTYGEHYSKDKFQATEFIIDGGHGTGFCIGNVMKYAQRYGKKGSHADARKDLLKVLHYALIQLYIHDKEESDPLSFNIDLNLPTGYPEPFEASYSGDLQDPLDPYRLYPRGQF